MRMGCTAKIMDYLKNHRTLRGGLIVTYVIPNSTLYLETIGQLMLDILRYGDVISDETGNLIQLAVFAPTAVVFGWSLIRNNTESYLKDSDGFHKYNFHEDSEPSNAPLLGEQTQTSVNRPDNSSVEVVVETPQESKQRETSSQPTKTSGWQLSRNISAATAKAVASLYSNFNFWKKHTGSLPVAVATTAVCAPGSFYTQYVFSAKI